jgi:hypothetical protein
MSGSYRRGAALPIPARAIARPVLRGRAADAALVAALVVGSCILRTGAMRAGYWTDESIAVGIASHPLTEIPATLRLDGSPPLYYLLLHAWIALAGTSEPATRCLSLAFALAVIPVAMWAGTTLFGRRAGLLAAAGAAGAPFLTQYAQETRMYTLVVLLSLVACTAFVLAFLDGRRVHLITLGAALTTLLYTHNWGLFLCAALAGAWLTLLARGRVGARDGLLVAAAVVVLYAPWLPTLAFQAAHTGAPWADRPSPLLLLAAPALLLGTIGAPLLVAPVVAGLRRRDPGHERVVLLLGIAAATVVLAWIASQLQPAWATRYLAVALGPLLVGTAGALASGGRRTAVVLAGVALVWALWQPPSVKSNVRTVATRIAPLLRPGDVVLSASPEVVPNLAGYLPAGLRFYTPSGPVTDVRVTDWRDVVARIRGTSPREVLDSALAARRPGARLVLITPIVHQPPPQAPLWRAERVRSRELRALVAADRRLQQVASAPASVWPRRRSQVRADVYVSATP